MTFVGFFSFTFFSGSLFFTSLGSSFLVGFLSYIVSAVSYSFIGVSVSFGVFFLISSFTSSSL
jgi:hypothetical protein